MRRIWRKLLFLARRSQFEAELEEEMRLHREMRPERPFGNMTALRESSREEWSWRWVEELIQNIRYGGRMLARSPGFTFVAAATLALGIGANTAVFSILDAVLLRPLPYYKPDRLVVIYDQLAHRPEHGVMFAPYADFDAYQHEAKSFSSLAADTWAMGSKIWRHDSRSTTLLTVQVTRDFFRTLGVHAELGRTFNKSDADAGCAVVLSNKFWRTKLLSDPGVLKRGIILDQIPCQVVGVMPAGFEFYPRVTPLWMLATPATTGRDNFIVGTVARLKPDVTIAQAQAEVSSIHRALRLKEDHETVFEPRVDGIQEEFTFLAGRTLRKTIWLMAGAAFCVLLIACVNVANLWTGKAWGRERELAVRAAIGAGRARMIRQLLTEALLLAVAGSIAGLLLAWGAVRAFDRMTPIELPVGTEVTINMQVIVFSCCLTAGTTLLFGLLPASRVTNIDINESLKAAARNATLGHARQGLSRSLVALEVALSVVLLAGAGSLLTSLQRMNDEPLGFDPHGIAVSSVSLQVPAYANSDTRLQFYRRLQEGLRPRQDFAFTSSLPPSVGGSDVLQIQGRVKHNAERAGDTGSAAVDPNYFSLMRTKLLAGREFDERDGAKAPAVAIVNKSLEREYFPQENALGQQIRVGAGKPNAWLTIVGIVEDEKHTQLMHEMSWASNPMVYRPLEQDPPAQIEILAREQDGATLHKRQNRISALDPDVPVSDWEMLNVRLTEVTKFARFRAALVGSFAMTALLLAAVGVHGVLTQFVALRTSEFGIRIALGAQARDVFWLVTKQGGVSILAGLAAGVLTALICGRYLTSLFYEGQSGGMKVLFVVVAALSSVALVAIWLPAWRASRVDPAVSLRHE